MIKMIIGAIAALAVNAQAASAPRLQVTRMTGTLKIETPDRLETATGRKLPSIESGSVVQVLSGEASFESDLHATIRARTGASFIFTALAPRGREPASLRVWVLEGSKPGALDVNAGSERFIIGRQGAVISISSKRRGGLLVQSVAGNIEIVPGNSSEDENEFGPVSQTGVGMDSGDRIFVSVARGEGFEKAPVNPAHIKIARKSATTFTAFAFRPDPAEKRLRRQKTESIVESWPPIAKQTALAMLAQYGPPDEFSKKNLIWNNNGPWNKSVVSARPEDGILRQYINHDVPIQKAQALARLGAGLKSDLRARELSSASDSEETNYLALNLAHEVITEKMSAEQARELYVKTATLAKAGKSSPAMQRLLFDRP